MKRKASAVWKGNLLEGNGTISTASQVLDNTQYSFKTRFEEGKGTNPEELIGAAHAGCFSMALSLQLGEMGLTPDYINTTATVTLEKVESGFAITHIHLDMAAKVPGTDQATFLKAATWAKENCPVSRLFNTTITMEAKLVGSE